MIRFTVCLFVTLLSLGFAIPCTASTKDIDALMKFAGNIHQFNSIFPQEKVYLQFDNTSYYTGENIWFKAFVVNASNLDRAESRILYVDLISPTGVLLKQEKLKIIGGQADGCFSLVDASTAQSREKRGMMNYPSGFYEIRAYTSFMLNFPKEAIFSRVFAVYEKPEYDGEYYETSPVIKFMKTDLTVERQEPEKLKLINADFYPEGGHLIIGKPCRVAFKVTGSDGMGIEASGSLGSQGIRFSTLHDGMGEFTFTPTEGRNSVEISAGGTTRSFSLPQTELSGCTMHVTQPGNDSLSISISSTMAFWESTLGLTITCRGEVMEFQTVDMSQEGNDLELSMYGIPEGVCSICLFDQYGTVYASRHFYHRSRTTGMPTLDVTSEKSSFQPFEHINLKLSLKDSQGLPFRDRFCISVRDIRGQESRLAGDIRTDLLLSSDLRGFIENPSWYFDSEDSVRDKALDLLTLVQGWERYDWQTMTGNRDFTEVHRLEKQLTLNGWILRPNGKKPLEGVEVLAAMMPEDKTQSETYTYWTDSTGYFGFDIGAEFYDKARFSIDTHVKNERLIGTSARIRFDRSITPPIRQYQQQELVFSPISNSGNGGKPGRMGDVKDVDDGLPTVIDMDRGFVLPDVEIEEERMYLDYYAYTAYDVVKDVELELDNGNYSTDLAGYLLDKGYDVTFAGEPGSEEDIKAINGYEPFFYVHNSTKCLQNYSGTMDTRDIIGIIVYDSPMYLYKIIRQCPLYEKYLEHTITILTDDELKFHRYLLVEILIKENHQLCTRKELIRINKRLTTVDGYSRSYSFYAPEYPAGPIPGDVDYRRTLYWEPNVITDSLGQAEIDFYNNSITKHINVSAAGITSSGAPYAFDRNF